MDAETIVTIANTVNNLGVSGVLLVAIVMMSRAMKEQREQCHELQQEVLKALLDIARQAKRIN